MNAVPHAERRLARYIAGRLDLSSLESSRAVLQCIAERGPLPLADLARRAGLSQGTCSLHVQRLEHEGLIRRAPTPRRGVGRPSVVVEWDAPANAVAAFVFGAPYLHAGASDFALHPLHRESVELSGVRARPSLRALVRALAKRAARAAAARGARLRHAAVFLPGLIDPATGIVAKAANLSALEGVDWASEIARACGAPCAAVPLGLAFYFGESETLPADANAMVINWDLGIGVVFGHGDRLQPFGADAGDGAPTLPELGHLRIERQGRLCRCGQRGCLEAYAGGRALATALAPRARRLDDVIDLIRARDPVALREVRRAAELIGRHLASAAHIMRASRIRICGPMAAVFDVVRSDFIRGLGSLLTPLEIRSLHISATAPDEERFMRGGYRLARRLFSHPADYAALLHTPRSLDSRASG